MNEEPRNFYKMKRYIFIILLTGIWSLSFKRAEAQLTISCSSIESSTVDLAVSGCSNIIWLDNSSTHNPRVILIAGIYTVKCNTDNTTTSITIPDPVACPAPCNIVASANPTTINSGSSSTLTATGCTGTVTWNNGAGSGTSVVVSPGTSTTYTATCSTGSTCTSQTTVTVNPPVCNIIASANPATILAGNSTTLTATGCAGTVTWDNGAGNGTSVIVSPGTTTTYTASCSIGSPCASEVTVSVVSKPDCDISASASPSNIFNGNSSTLSATGCIGTVSWNNGAGNGPSVSVSPGITTTYTATCTITTLAGDITCQSLAVVNVTNTPACNMSASANPSTLLVGQPVTLTATGCTGTVYWSAGQSGSSIVVYPQQSLNYVATCTIVTPAGNVTCDAETIVKASQPYLSISANSNIMLYSEAIWTATAVQNVDLFKWQYSFDAEIWFDAPSGFNNNNHLTTSAHTLLGSKAADYLNKDIYIRAYNDLISSNTLTVTIRQNAPIITQITSTIPTCSGFNDAKFTVSLNRGLLPDEEYFLLRVFTLIDGVESPEYDQYIFSTNTFTSPDTHGSRSYRLKLQSVIKGKGSYDYIKDFTIEGRPEFSFSANGINIKCFGGNDGQIIANASGGTETYQYSLGNNDWHSFAGKELKIGTLKLGDYSLEIKDSNGCQAQEGPLGIRISQPESALSIGNVTTTNPLGYQRKDGFIALEVTGGTRDYTFNWSETGALINENGETGVAHFNSGLGDGTYTLTITDANYATAIDKAGCITQGTYKLKEPPQIEVVFKIIQAIQCFGRAEGSVLAEGSGGVPFEEGNTYSYRWKVKSSSQLITDDTGLAEFLMADTYICTVTDKNNVSRDFEFVLGQPAKLVAKITSVKHLLCYGDRDGSAVVSVEGGTAPYTIYWNNEQEGNTAKNLIAGKYFAFVSDAHECMSQTNVSVNEPAKLKAQLIATNPTCFDKCDGKIVASLSGGKALYSFAWANLPNNTLTLDKLCEGNYKIAVKDSNGCAINDSTRLIKPAKKEVILRTNSFICAGQTIALNATLAEAVSYHWKTPQTDTITTPIINVKAAGLYTVLITDKNNCQFNSQIDLKASSATLNQTFAVASKIGIGQKLVIVNLSEPKPDKTTWVIPSGATVTTETEDLLELSFAKPGEYTLIMRSTKGECEFESIKKIIVTTEPQIVVKRNESADDDFIKDFAILPNPTNGDFKVRASIREAEKVRIKIMDTGTNGKEIFQSESTSATEHELPIYLPDARSGTYVIILETSKGVRTLKLVVVK